MPRLRAVLQATASSHDCNPQPTFISHESAVTMSGRTEEGRSGRAKHIRRLWHRPSIRCQQLAPDSLVAVWKSAREVGGRRASGSGLSLGAAQSTRTTLWAHSGPELPSHLTDFSILGDPSPLSRKGAGRGGAGAGLWVCLRSAGCSPQQGYERQQQKPISESALFRRTHSLHPGRDRYWWRARGLKIGMKTQGDVGPPGNPLRCGPKMVAN
ncbi:uncharacterized protein LOC119466701 [Cebus imitator]|uniref:uncharacterized protein LOC119466701 n=1 Tax=Cebus imitator TaxID=2715852 RepID=UPI0018998DAA|nr:uncharacterized protein LOC119466701 [Cebus imitator]